MSNPSAPSRDDGEAFRWRFRRVSYRAALCGLFASIAFYFGPNLYLFDKLTWIEPDDFAADVRRRGVPFVRAVLEYQRDHGKLPNRAFEQLDPAVVTDARGGDVDKGKVTFVGRFSHSITYDLTNPTRPWSVRGPFTSGVIDAPPVTIAPATGPAKQGTP